MSDEPNTLARTHTHTRQGRDAVPRALELAKTAAERKEHAEALAWLQTLEGVGHRLDPIDENKRAS